MRQMELSGPGACAAPFADSFAVRGIFQNSRVAVTVRNKNASVWTECDVRRADKLAARILRLAADVNLHQLFALRRKLNYGGTVCVDSPDISLRVKPDAVRNFVETFAPRTQNFSFTIDHEHRIGFFATLQKVDGSLCVKRDPRNHSGFPIRVRRLNDEIRRRKWKFWRSFDHRAQMSGGFGASILSRNTSLSGEKRRQTKQKHEKSDGHGRIVARFALFGALEALANPY